MPAAGPPESRSRRTPLRLRPHRARRLAAGLAILAAAVLTAPAASAEPRRGGTLTVTTERNPDFLDPQLAYSAESWQVLVNTGNGLMTYRRAAGAEGGEVVPDLAQAPPQVSDGGRTLTFALRRGVRFSPPASREVQASDVKASLERIFLLDSRGAGLYTGIVGADALWRARKGGLAGVSADDAAGRVVIRLTRPDPSFVKVLALPFAFVLPRDTPAVDQSAAPPVATGPYYVRRYEPDRQIELARNPGWVRAGPDADAAHVDRIVVQIGVSPAESLRRLAAGEADYTQSRLGRDALPRGVRVQRQVEAATYYYFMNTTVPPFDDVRVRRAVNLAIDRARIARLFEGEAVATQQVLPPTVPGYRRIAPFGEPDLARARALVRRAGETGARVTVWGYNTEPSPAVTAYLAGVLRTIGLRPTTRFLDKSTALRTVATRATKAQIGYARWQSDFPDGADYFSLLLHGRSVRATDGLNYSYLNHPGLNRLIEAAEREFDPARRAEAWSQVDRAVADIAPWAPFANSVRTDLTSGRVRGYLAHPVYGFVWLRAGVA